MRLPNAVMVGVPKCGTTSVFNYLADHPQVCPSSQKETYFLIDKGHPLYRAKRNFAATGLDGYASYFGAGTGAEAVVFEATPDYFYQNTAFRVLADLTPRPLILFLLREPAERAFSLFQFAKYMSGKFPADYTFTDYVDDLFSRRKEKFRHDAILENAVEHGKYSAHAGRWLRVFGATGTAFFLFEKLVEDPVRFMQGLSVRLGIDPSFYSAYGFEKKNPTRAVKSIPLLRLKNLFRDLDAKRFVKPFIMPFYRRLNVRDGRIAKTDADIRTISRLKCFYSGYNDHLRLLTGLDTTVWSHNRSET